MFSLKNVYSFFGIFKIKNVQSNIDVITGKIANKKTNISELIYKIFTVFKY